MSDKRPIIIVKKKGGHGGHHGGAWKVAYADFVTAMMALFIVLWLMNTSKQIQESIGGYFRDPTGTAKKVGTNQTGAAENFVITKDNMQLLKEQLLKNMKKISNFDKLKNQIEMTVTAEGLRIELLETEKGTFFDTGSAQPTANGKELLTMLAQELGEVPNKLSIEGHTDSRPFAVGANYGNWELSSDRANVTRRLMQSNGVRNDQVSQMRGYADQRLRKKDNPEDPSNRRISIIVHYIAKPDDDENRDANEAGGSPAESEAKTSEASSKSAEQTKPEKPSPAQQNPASGEARK